MAFRPIPSLADALLQPESTIQTQIRESWSWFLYRGYHPGPPKVQPEPSRLFFKRLKPRLDHDAAMEKLIAEMSQIPMPPLNFKDVPAGSVYERLNTLITAHNRTSKSQIPPIKVRLFSENGGALSATDFSPLNSNHIWFTIQKASLWDLLSGMQERAYLITVPDQDALWLIPPSTSENELITRKYIVPRTIFPTREQVKTELDKLQISEKFAMTKWNFDPVHRILTLTTGWPQVGDIFEQWYAGQLAKLGYDSKGF